MATRALAISETPLSPHLAPTVEQAEYYFAQAKAEALRAYRGAPSRPLTVDGSPAPVPR